MQPPTKFPASQTSMCPPTALLTFSARSHFTISFQINRHHTSSLSFQLYTIEASRVYSFDLNENWQGDREHYDNQKVNGLTSPE